MSSRVASRGTVMVGASILLILASWSGQLGTVGASPPQRGSGPSGERWDPQKFLEQFLGGETDAQKEQLAKIEIAWEDERRFGQQALQAFLSVLREKDIRVVSRGPEVSYLQSLVAELKPLMQRAQRYRTISVLVAETPEMDARCFPGGTIIIFRGMLAAAQSEAALVSVLGHELSHIDHGHQLRSLKSLKLAQQTFNSGAATMDWQRMMNNGMYVAQLFARPFRPEEESEADADAVRWTYRLGYDPREFAKLFLRMEKNSEGRAANLPAFFRTHPYHRDRYEAVWAQYEELMRAEPRDDLYIGQKNLIQFVPRSKRPYKE